MNARQHRIAVFISPIACAAALAMVFTFAQPTALAHHDTPAVPGNIEAPTGNRVFLARHAVGTQNYICLPAGTSFAWTLFGPQATLFNDRGRQALTHFLSTNPLENLPRATWQDSRDTSRVWAQPIANSTDPTFVAAGAIAWLLLQKVGVEEGPSGGDALTGTTYIQRINTIGGTAPATGCSAAGNVGARALIEYEADYIFYRKHNRGEDNN